MHSRLILVPFAVLALACSGGSTGPHVGGPSVVSGDTNVTTFGFVAHSVVLDGQTYDFKVFVPANYNSVKKVPVVVFMHGGGDKGTDNEQQTKYGLGPIVRAQEATFP